VGRDTGNGRGGGGTPPHRARGGREPHPGGENVEERLGLDPGAFAPRADYLLRVRGESMREAGILDGDLLAVHRTPVAENGQVVVARLEDEVTVKRFERKGDVVTLHPANPDFAPIRVRLKERPLVIEGLGVGVLRRGPLA
jgi:repressor LexA